MAGPVHRMLRHRQGFTLIEMLVVIGIILIFLGLSIGALMRTPSINKLIGTEQVMSDIIRQARDTARSTGSPVQVMVSKVNRTVSGVSQIPVWNETFENPPQSDISNNFITTLGQTGQGLIGTTTMAAGTPPASYALTATQSLARNPTQLDGFYLAAAILPPDPQPPYYTYADGTPTPDIIPLVQVGDEDDTNAACGLALVLKSTTIQNVTPIASSSSGTPPTPFAACTLSWDLVGWLNDSNGYHWVGSVENSIANTLSPTYLPAGGLDVTGPIVGNRWEEVGLHYNGHTLELYRNGQKIAQVMNADTNGNFSTQPKSAAACGGTIFAGRGIFNVLATKGISPSSSQYADPTGQNNPPTVPPTQQRYLVGTLDNLRLLRLGTDRALALPGGVTPDGDYTFTVRPDGVVENTVDQGEIMNTTQSVSAEQNGSQTTTKPNTTNLGATITFQLMGEVSAGAAGANLDTAVVTIDSDGTVDMNTNTATNQVNTGVRTGGVAP